MVSPAAQIVLSIELQMFKQLIFKLVVCHIADDGFIIYYSRDGCNNSCAFTNFNWGFNVILLLNGQPLGWFIGLNAVICSVLPKLYQYFDFSPQNIVISDPPACSMQSIFTDLTVQSLSLCGRF